MKRNNTLKSQSGSIELISVALIMLFVTAVLVYFLIPMQATLATNAQGSANKNSKESAGCYGDTCVDCVPGDPYCHVPLPTPTATYAAGNNTGPGESWSCSCFSGDTPVLLADGKYKNIENIAVGDLVLAIDDVSSPEIETPKAQKVEQVFVHKKSEFLRLKIDDESVDTTPEHRFFAKDKGWVTAGSLTIGDLLITAEGKYKVLQSKETIKQDITVYNLEVEKSHTFFVGSSSFWVHNKKGGGLLPYVTADMNNCGPIPM